MEKFVVIALIFLWLIFFSYNHTGHYDYYDNILSEYWDQFKNDGGELWSDFVTWTGKPENEYNNSISIKKYITQINNLINLTLDSRRVFEFTFGHTIADIIRKDLYEFVDSYQNCCNKMRYQ